MFVNEKRCEGMDVKHFESNLWESWSALQCCSWECSLGWMTDFLSVTRRQSFQWLPLFYEYFPNKPAIVCELIDCDDHENNIWPPNWQEVFTNVTCQLEISIFEKVTCFPIGQRNLKSKFNTSLSCHFPLLTPHFFVLESRRSPESLVASLRAFSYFSDH